MARADAGAAERTGFLAWWLGELRAMLPARVTRRPVRRPAAVLFYRDGVVRVLEVRRGGLEEVGSFLLEPPRAAGGRLPARPEQLAPIDLLDRLRRRRRLLLRLAADHGLRVRDLLPATAERELRTIVAHRLDSLTPWTPEQACFDVEVASRRPDGRILVTVAAVPRGLVERVRDRLAELGIEVEAVDLGEAEGPPVARFDLADGAARRGGALLEVAGAVVVGAVVLVGATLAGSEIHARRAVLAERERVAAMLEARLADLAELRARLESLRREAGQLTARLAAAPSALAVLDALSRALPDEVFLSELALERDRLRIGGFAPSASPLVPLLEALPALDDVRFEAPSTRTVLTLPGGIRRELERFVLAARVVGGRGSAP